MISCILSTDPTAKPRAWTRRYSTSLWAVIYRRWLLPVCHLVAGVGHPVEGPPLPPRRPWHRRPGPPHGSPDSPGPPHGSFSKRRCGAGPKPDWETGRCWAVARARPVEVQWAVERTCSVSLHQVWVSGPSEGHSAASESTSSRVNNWQLAQLPHEGLGYTCRRGDGAGQGRALCNSAGRFTRLVTQQIAKFKGKMKGHNNVMSAISWWNSSWILILICFILGYVIVEWWIMCMS